MKIQRLSPILLLIMGFCSAFFVLTQTSWGVKTLGAKSFDRQLLPNAAVYQGELDEEGLFTGHAILTWSNGDIYQGQFDQGLMHGKGLLSFSQGDVYSGDFDHGKMQGYGQWLLADGDSYSGDIAKDGLFHGRGVYISATGGHYTGEFKKGLFHGQGVYLSDEKNRYHGEFFKGEFSGTGSFTDQEEGTLVGEFKNWKANGLGFKSDHIGNQWRGQFKDGQLNGKGEFIGKNGDYYKGQFSYDRFHGEGELTDNDGNTYSGGFNYGVRHGKGQYEFVEALDGVKKFSGTWRRDELIKGDDKITIFSAEDIAEQAMYEQQTLLEKSFSTLERPTSETPELFLLGVAGWGKEEVFRREINFVEQQLNDLYGLNKRSLFLVNSQRSIDNRPIATLRSIELSIQQLAKVMDTEKDILMIYATSHGSKKSGFALAHKGIALEDLMPQHLKSMLDDSGIKHRVVIISACYSGQFIEPLKNDQTLVMTAASKDKTSFGCSDDSLLTYFGKAFFQYALTDSSTFIDAFTHAKILIQDWENEEGVTASQPQISSGTAIENQLKKWRKSLNHSQKELDQAIANEADPAVRIEN